MIYLNLLILYVIGVPCWVWFEKKFLPWNDGDYCFDDNGEVYEETREMWMDEVCARAILWPLCLCAIIIMIPFMLVEKIFDWV